MAKKSLMERTPTIEDVARAAGVSQMTVSRVVNNHPSVKLPTRTRVLEAITATGYQQNEAGRLLRGSRAKMIGIIVPDLSDVFFATCAHTIQQIARSHQYMTLVVSSERDLELELQEAELMSNRKVAGLLVATSEQKTNKRLPNLYQSGMAIVAFDRPFKSIQTDAVLVENRQGAEMAVAHLIGHGHRRIACVGYDASVYTVHERVEGYKSAMSSAGLLPNIVPEMATLEEIHQWTTKLAKKANRPTAIFSLNHRTSAHLVRSLSMAGLSVPKDIALIGFDDFDLAECVSPPLTVVAQSPMELASRATALLFDQIHAGANKKPIPIKMVIPVQLIVRSSCGCS